MNATACRYSAACCAAGAEPRWACKRDVAEILEREHAKIGGVSENLRAPARASRRTALAVFTNGSDVVVERGPWTREHERLAVAAAGCESSGDPTRRR